MLKETYNSTHIGCWVAPRCWCATPPLLRWSPRNGTTPRLPGDWPSQCEGRCPPGSVDSCSGVACRRCPASSRRWCAVGWTRHSAVSPRRPPLHPGCVARGRSRSCPAGAFSSPLQSVQRRRGWELAGRGAAGRETKSKPCLQCMWASSAKMAAIYTVWGLSRRRCRRIPHTHARPTVSQSLDQSTCAQARTVGAQQPPAGRAGVVSDQFNPHTSACKSRSVCLLHVHTPRPLLLSSPSCNRIPPPRNPAPHQTIRWFSSQNILRIDWHVGTIHTEPERIPTAPYPASPPFDNLNTTLHPAPYHLAFCSVDARVPHAPQSVATPYFTAITNRCAINGTNTLMRSFICL